MNWVDFFILAVLAVFTYEGVGRSFLNECLDLIAFFTAFFSSLLLYGQASKLIELQFQLPHSLANIFGFLVVWFLVESLLFLVIRLLLFRTKQVLRFDERMNKFSPIPAFFRGLLFISLMLLMTGTFPLQPQIKKAVSNSVLGSHLLYGVEKVEAPFRSVFGGLSQDTLSFLTVKPHSDESVNLGFSLNDFFPNEKLELQMFDLVNTERTKRGIPTLTIDPNLREIARAHSADMFQRGYFAHHTPEGKNVADRADAAGIKYLVIGENLAYAPSLDLAHQGLMNSQGHRENILSLEYHKIGIGIMDGKEYGLMITQVFSN